MEKPWFKRKRYGWGWTPATWQGWLIIAFYVGSVFFFAHNAKNFTKNSDVIIGLFIPTAMFTILLFIVAWAKGEKSNQQ